MVITAAMVKELRERTGIGMMECKRALEVVQGDMEAALLQLRKSGQAKLSQKAGRVASEGAIFLRISDDARSACMVEVNCETDFAARDREFLAFGDAVALAGLKGKSSILDDLLALPLTAGSSIEERRRQLIGQIGENITIRRIEFKELLPDQPGAFYGYVHGGNRLGAWVALAVVNAELGRDLAMHIVATAPLALQLEELDPQLIAREREIALATLENSNKPQAIQEKIVEGRLAKFASEVVLLNQPFVKNPALGVAELLAEKQAKIYGFVRFALGEGLEKRRTDFAAEVKMQVESRG